MNTKSLTDKILEGKDITNVLMGSYIKEDADNDSVYYEIVYNTFKPAIIKVDRPTTDYGALVDILIDNLEEELEKSGDGMDSDGVLDTLYLMDINTAEKDHNDDEYVIGGNHGLALLHGGALDIFEITPEKADQYNKEENVPIYSEL